MHVIYYYEIGFICKNLEIIRDKVLISAINIALKQKN